MNGSEVGGRRAEVGSPESRLADHWMEAVARGPVVLALEAVYSSVEGML